jgi:hypothetical protein
MVEPYAKVTQVWAGGPNSLTDPEDMETLTFSRKELIEFGGGDKEKINFTLEYDVTKLAYSANISIALVFDKSIVVSQTDLKNVQGVGYSSYRMRGLPKYENKMKVGQHTLNIVIKLRPRYSIWHWIDNYKAFMELQSVAESRTSRLVVMVP